jgi:hypothetical protein
MGREVNERPSHSKIWKFQLKQNKKFKESLRPGVGNYFRSRATVRHYLCLVGHIAVKKAPFKLKKSPFECWIWPAGHILPNERKSIAKKDKTIF